MTATQTPAVWRWARRATLVVVALLVAPFGMLAFGDIDLQTHWSEASRASSGQAPDPLQTPQAVVQVYAARAYNWRGAFAIHTWIAAKRTNAPNYTVFQVVAWNLRHGDSVVSVTTDGVPDALWYNAVPTILVEHVGPGVDGLIGRIEEAVAAYPHAHQYRVWPGPNSNTFTAFVARRIPELGLDLPPTAIGKDFLGDSFVARSPSCTGWQVSMLGLLGLTLARQEGVELNVLGLSAGIDFNDLALRIPGLGRVALISSASGPQSGADESGSTIRSRS